LTAISGKEVEEGEEVKEVEETAGTFRSIRAGGLKAARWKNESANLEIGVPGDHGVQGSPQLRL
jgi:hypothetical protein